MINKEIIAKYISENADVESIDYDLEIFEEGLVNSLFAIDLMTFLERNFDIKIKIEDLDMENFKSVNAIINFINKKREVQNV
ncbi:D-alanine--poly(phosphoribitol) ligase, subunit 2 [Clostridium cavendishii DSM 21758]|uniref:D-alanine--poly(Phosphoribitol) ligase, subunit 2 n=1 Tax=Clostridium cavendishii DSM 21758 TaxID=1121302 RepID=A0A1M6MTJ1_9CLOT|nr:phosphopantetheine-binding protein [Clostridium cavendishii]SHJ86801.1 D-alanine--poly(phosphoribitol) ligase, subunit 2 [Clostridium cavendishii DSM 21758]